VVTLAKPPHPVTKYCITILIVLEVTQKRARPLGNDKEMKANISGIIHSIILLCACCLGSALEGVVIFCCSHIVPPTRMGSKRKLSGIARFSHRNLFPKGSVEYTNGQE